MYVYLSNFSAWNATLVVMESSDHFTNSDLWVSFSKIYESFFESFRFLSKT